MQSPQLLYHAHAPTLYPTNDPDRSMLTIRFASAVRIASIRITPEGVQSPSGPGITYPAIWSGELFLNLSTSDPVNALGRSKLEYMGEGWPVDYQLDMPEGISTRMVSIVAPVHSLTISIYGHHAASSSRDPAPSKSVAMLDTAACSKGKEDLAWVSQWAGGTEGLLDLLGSQVEEEVKTRALACLEVLQDSGQPGILPGLMQRRSALEYLLLMQHESNLITALLADPEYALHPTTRSAVPASHDLHPLIRSDISLSDQRKAAWREVDCPDRRKAQLALYILAKTAQECGDAWAEISQVSEGAEGSNLFRLLVTARVCAERRSGNDGKVLELALDIIDSAILARWPALTDEPSHKTSERTDLTALEHLATVLPPLTVISNILNSTKRQVTVPVTYASTVVRQLCLCSTEVVVSTLASSTARELAVPYIPHLPLDSPYRAALLSSSIPPSRTPTASKEENVDARRLQRLYAGLDHAPSAPSAIIHSATPAELIKLLAPAYLTLLSSAPQPPLGIPTTLTNPTPESQASAWAGKVYSSNEFRERGERADRMDRSGSGAEMRVGLGIRGMSNSSIVSAVGSGGGIGGLAGAGGLGPAGRMSRPASRHVDEYAR